MTYLEAWLVPSVALSVLVAVACAVIYWREGRELRRAEDQESFMAIKAVLEEWEV